MLQFQEMLTRKLMLHNCVMGDDKYDASTFRNLPASPSIPAALDGFKLSNNFKIISSSTQMNEKKFFFNP